MKSEPQYSYKLYSYKKQSVPCDLINNVLSHLSWQRVVALIVKSPGNLNIIQNRMASRIQFTEHKVKTGCHWQLYIFKVCKNVCRHNHNILSGRFARSNKFLYARVSHTPTWEFKRASKPSQQNNS